MMSLDSLDWSKKILKQNVDIGFWTASIMVRRRSIKLSIAAAMSNIPTISFAKSVQLCFEKFIKNAHRGISKARSAMFIRSRVNRFARTFRLDTLDTGSGRWLEQA